MSVRRSMAWMAGAQGGAFVTQFAASIVLSRFLTPFEFGICALAASIIGALSLVQSLGLQSLIVREATLTDGLVSAAFTVNALLAVGLSLAILAISVAGGRFLGEPAVSRVLMLLSITPLFGILDFRPISNLERVGDFKAISICAISGSTASAVSAILLCVNGYSFYSIPLAQICGLIVGTTMSNIIGRRFVRFDVSFRDWGRVGGFGLQMLAVSGVNALSARLCDFAGARILGLGGLGQISRAGAVNNLLWNNLHIVLGRVLLVNFADLAKAKAPLRESYIRCVETVTALLWPAFAGLAVLSGPFIYRVYGPQWLPAAPLVAALAAASIVQVSITMTWEIFAATGELKIQTRIEFIRALVSFLLFVVACPFGLTAIGGARIVDAFFAVWFYRPHLNTMTKTTASDFRSVYIRSAILTVLAITPATTAVLWYALAPDMPIPAILAAVAGGIALWAAGLHWLDHALYIEGVRTMRGVLKLRPAAERDRAPAFKR